MLAAAGLAVRRILLDRGGGTVECGLRRPAGTWRLGVAAYGEDELRWYDTVGVLLTPEEVLAGATHHAAQALGLAGQTGQLAPGAVADFVVWDIQQPEELGYWVGFNPCRAVVRSGVLAAGPVSRT